MRQVMYFLCFLLLGLGVVCNPPGCLAEQGYVIGDEDILQISVWGTPELTVQVPVRPDGMITVPLIGDVKVTGVEPQALKKELEKEYANFIKSPTVSVIIKEINSFKVYVLGTGGETSNGGASPASGVVTLRRNTTLMQLLAQTGSFKGADLNRAYLLRNGKKLNNDFYRLIEKGDISQDIQLANNDIIFIPDNFDNRIKVVGAVKTPVVVQYREGLTASDAILSAGGFNEFAKENDVIVVRKDDKKIENIEARLKDVMHDGDLSKDVPLRPGDMIIVRTGLF